MQGGNTTANGRGHTNRSSRLYILRAHNSMDPDESHNNENHEDHEIELIEEEPD